jgi:hypothetical protein
MKAAVVLKSGDVTVELAQTCARSTVSRMSNRSVDNVILGSKGWTEFYASVVAIADETGKGDCFEHLMQLYMQSAPHMVSHYKHVWLRTEVPGDVKKALGLPYEAVLDALAVDEREVRKRYDLAHRQALQRI